MIVILSRATNSTQAQERIEAIAQVSDLPVDDKLGVATLALVFGAEKKYQNAKFKTLLTVFSRLNAVPE